MPSVITNLYAFGDFRLDAKNRLLRQGEKPIALTPKAFEVLLLLIQQSGQVVSKDELMRTIWPDSFVEESNLTQTVFLLRKALSETPEQRSSTASPRIEISQPKPTGHHWGKKIWPVTGAVVLVLVVAMMAYFRWSNSRVPAQKERARVMLAVLPFQNLTGDPSQEYFSDGLTEENACCLRKRKRNFS